MTIRSEWISRKPRFEQGNPLKSAQFPQIDRGGGIVMSHCIQAQARSGLNVSARAEAFARLSKDAPRLAVLQCHAAGRIMQTNRDSVLRKSHPVRGQLGVRAGRRC